MEATGIVFDIQRFSLHDGPGIRTTVFLKGCPLRCMWCHNPESWRPQPQLSYQADLCALCGACAEACPRGVHTLGSGGHAVDFARCAVCGRCAEVCTRGALKIVGREMTVSRVMTEVLADVSFYRRSGGGLTVTGGEPLFQANFLSGLLRTARESGVHTCVETSGYASRASFDGILDCVDLFLFDIKHTDDSAHRRLTGASNRVILENLDHLCARDADILLRCPIVPGLNDDDEHVRAVAELTRRYPQLRGVEILPYHNMGREKWQQIGRPYELADLGNSDTAARQALLRRFQEAGCRNVTI